MAYSVDRSSLFSYGTSNEGHSYLVEWNECEGDVKRTYNGFHKRSLGVVQFDTTKNCFLAAGDEFVIKVWDMDSVNLLTTIDADEGLREHIEERALMVILDVEECAKPLEFEVDDLEWLC